MKNIMEQEKNSSKNLENRICRKEKKNMNTVILSGRFVKDAEIRYSQGSESMAIARFTLAVDRRTKKEGEQNADFIQCVAFKKTAEFIEKYLHKGSKVIVSGRWQTGSYTDKETGKKVYTNDCMVDSIEFAESKASQAEQKEEPAPTDFMDIPENVQEELPFN